MKKCEYCSNKISVGKEMCEECTSARRRREVVRSFSATLPAYTSEYTKSDVATLLKSATGRIELRTLLRDLTREIDNLYEKI